jgi:CTP:molybdopterin cytidylyltransferase MocA
VLAAGESRRFGSQKQLVRIAGRPLLHTAVTRASEVTGSAVIVVLGCGAAELGALLKHSPGSIVINQEWREGLSSSIRAGIARLPLTCAGAMLLLADQPLVSADDLRRLAGTWRKQPQYIAAALCSVPPACRRSFRAACSRRSCSCAGIPERAHCCDVLRIAWCAYQYSAAIDIDTPEDRWPSPRPSEDAWQVLPRCAGPKRPRCLRGDGNRLSVCRWFSVLHLIQPIEAVRPSVSLYSYIPVLVFNVGLPLA